MSLVRSVALGLCATVAIFSQQAVKNLKYEGGSLPLVQHSKLTVMVGSENITLTQAQQQFALPVSCITGILYGSKVHERVKTAVAAGLLLTPLAPLAVLKLLRKGNHRYVGLTWTEPNARKEGGAILEVGSKNQYRVLLAAVSAATGKKAVNTDLSSGGK